MINLPIGLDETHTPTVEPRTNKDGKSVLYISDLTDFLNRKKDASNDYQKLNHRAKYIRGLLESPEVINQLSGLEKCVLICLSFFASIEKALGVKTGNNHGFKAYDNRATTYLQRMETNHAIEDASVEDNDDYAYLSLEELARADENTTQLETSN